MRTMVIVVLTAGFAFAGGLWTGATIAISQPATHPSTVSPSAMHLQVEPTDLPSTSVDQYN
jgi:hypothetical protein